MNEVSKFIPMEESSENIGGNVESGIENAGSTNGGVDSENSAFKVCGTSDNLPAKPSLWSKIKKVLFTEITVELTPSQQKVEDELNDILHREITWQSIKDFLFKEVKFKWGN